MAGLGASFWIHRLSPLRWYAQALIALLLCSSVTVAVQQDSTELSQLLDRAQSALDAGSLENAASLLERALDLDPFHKPARQTLVDVLMRLRRGEEASAQVETLRRQYPSDPQVVLLAATVAFHRAQFEEAEKCADQALETGPRTAAILRIRAFARFMLEDYEGYVADLKVMTEIAPDSGEAHYHLGRFYYENQQFAVGLSHLQKATELDPGHSRAFFFLGWCQQAQGDLADAKASYRRSIEIIENQGLQYGWPFSDLGEILITEGDFSGGLGWLYRGIRNDPGLPYCRYKYASALMRENPTPEVEEHLLKAVELDPGYTEAYYLLGRYYQGAGEKDKAREAFARFQELRQNPEASPFGVKRGR